MKTTPEEYYLISELISMEDRQTAQRAETLIWDADGQVREKVLERMVNAVMSAPTAIEFHQHFPDLCVQIAEDLGLKAATLKSEDVYKCKMAGPDLHSFRME